MVYPIVPFPISSQRKLRTSPRRIPQSAANSTASRSLSLFIGAPVSASTSAFVKMPRSRNRSRALPTDAKGSAASSCRLTAYRVGTPMALTTALMRRPR
jgi:hypothetical protein